MSKKTFIVELRTDYPIDIDATIVHRALIKYFIGFVQIDVKETPPPPTVDGEKP